jgi:UDP-glucose 4-epimerase
MVLPRFVSQALSGNPITIHGDGAQSRCFGWVGDVVQALIRLGSHEDAVGSIFNIGSDQEVTINQLAELVKDVTGSSSPIRHVSYEEAYGKGFEDMFRRVPDLSRIRAAIGYAPTKNLREIVQAVTDSLVQRDLVQRDLCTTENENEMATANLVQAD